MLAKHLLLRTALVILVAACGSDAGRSSPEPQAGSFTTYSAAVGDNPARVIAAQIRSDFFVTNGVKPYLGRSFTTAEFGTGAHVVMLSNAFWNDRFGGQPAIIGSSMTVDGVERVVVGVMPPGFDIPEGVAVWVPAASAPTAPGG